MLRARRHEQQAERLRDLQRRRSSLCNTVTAVALMTPRRVHPAFVGGIGVANIMPRRRHRKRTREIGIAPALGAPRRAILLFLAEAVMLTGLGGVTASRSARDPCFVP